MNEVDSSIKSTMGEIIERWGGRHFDIEIIENWKSIIKRWKDEDGKIVHLTMYGTVLIFLGLFMPGGLVRTRWLWPVVQRLGFGEEIDYFKKSGTLRVQKMS